MRGKDVEEESRERHVCEKLKRGGGEDGEEKSKET